jgi:primosomal protein N' (replication factor Y)
MQDPLFGERETAVARVALPVPIDRLFDYRVPEALAASALPGSRATLRFGGRPMTGVVVERVEASQIPEDERHTGQLSPLGKILDDTPALSLPLMETLREQAREILCPVGIALAAALPPGAAPRVERRAALSPRGEAALGSGALRGDARTLLEALASGPLPVATISRKLAGAGPLLASLERDALVTLTSRSGAPAVRAARVRTVRVSDGTDVAAICAGPLARAPAQAALLQYIDERGTLDTPQLRHDRPGSDASLRALAKRGLVVFAERAAEKNVLGAPVPRDEPAILTDDQRAAFETVTASIHAQKDDTFLLHGVTGSGKTEVYLRAVAEALSAGRQALVLVPEITLTHQIVARLRMRFGDELAVLHSGLRPSERLEQWQRLGRGATPIAVGARSALFAPLENLGLIVIDEEHDGAYKNEEGFRYHARELARKRARSSRCPLLLGSATPSLESRYAADQGQMQRLTLPRRIGGRPLPAVHVVDMAVEKERATRGRRIVLTRPLRRAMRETRERGEQTILFLNRRGFATRIMCFDCGAAEQCPNCDVALVYHATEQCLTCHYCDHSIAPPQFCSACGAPDSALLGIGTERLEEEVRRAMPEARIARLDRDTARRRGFTESVLNGLHEGRIDVLIGTQMVAKGHDFPGVSLVGVVAADVGLHMPDFRAAERTFQLLTQVAGRAGRANTPGRVIVQSFQPDHYAVDSARQHDYERFYKEELARRRQLGYPPLGRLARFGFSGEDEAETRAAARQVREALSAADPEECEVLGPAPAPLARLRGRHRHQLVLKAGDDDTLRRWAELGLAAAGQLPRTVACTLDLAPVSML